MCLRVKTKHIKYQPDSSKNESGFLLLKNMRGAKTVLIWFGKRTEKNEKMERIKTGFVLKSE
jgi:hypothetical protein